MRNAAKGSSQKNHVSIYIAAMLAVLAVGYSAVRVIKNARSPKAPTEGASAQALPLPAIEETNLSGHSIAGGGDRLTTYGRQASSESKSTSQVSLTELTRLLRQAGLTGSERQKVLRALVENGSPEAMAILKEALAQGTEEMRTAIADALGKCSSADCRQALLGLLNDRSEAVVRAAIRAVAQQGSVEGVQALTPFLYDQQRSIDVRADAASALGSMKQAGAVEALTQAAMTVNDSDMVNELLNALGTRDFSETKDFFLNYLRSPNISSELRSAAVEALAQAEGNPTEFLRSILADGDSEVRTAAAWALSATDAKGNAGQSVIGRLQVEDDPDVRLRLYQALRNQESFDVGTVINLLQQEQDSSVRIAGLDLLAKSVRDNPTTESERFFEQKGLPALKNAALNGDTRSERLAAVLALARAGTDSSLAALEELANQADDPKVKQAALGSVPKGTAAMR